MDTTRQIRSAVLGLFAGLAMMLTATAWASAAPAGDLAPGTYVVAGDGEDDDDSGWG